ncbi:MAG: hypothetical protein U0491_01965 [Candidatus Saccharimonadales bacterium]
MLERTLLRAGRMMLWRYGTGVSRVLVIGDGPAVVTLLKTMSGLSVLGIAWLIVF